MLIAALNYFPKHKTWTKVTNLNTKKVFFFFFLEDKWRILMCPGWGMGDVQDKVISPWTTPLPISVGVLGIEF